MIVADIDTGVDYTHPDLAANIWVNPGETAGNGVDDDGNGYVDDVFGIDTVNGDSDPMDDEGHGTHTAGTTTEIGKAWAWATVVGGLTENAPLAASTPRPSWPCPRCGAPMRIVERLTARQLVLATLLTSILHDTS